MIWLLITFKCIMAAYASMNHYLFCEHLCSSHVSKGFCQQWWLFSSVFNTSRESLFGILCVYLSPNSQITLLYNNLLMMRDCM